MSEAEDRDRDQLWSEATLWFARMRSPDAETFRPAFEEWLARGSLHRRYYNRASEYWVDSGSALSEERVQPAKAKAEQRRAHATKPRVIAAFGATLLVVASSSVRFGREHQPERESAPSTASRFTSADLSTGPGEHPAVRLADGSVVALGANTHLGVRFEAKIRRFDLAEGEARFDVAHEPRPFVVFAGGALVTAHGTLFDVEVSPDRRVSIRLIRGSIEVRLPHSGRSDASTPPRNLEPGEAVTFRAPEAAVSSTSANEGAGPREYRDAPLASVVAEANQGAAKPIRIANAAIGELRISGRFTIGDTEVLAARLAALFDLVVDQRKPGEIVLRPK